MATVKRALPGVDVVIQALGLSLGPEIIFEPTRLFSKSTQVLVTAMEQARVKRLICVTGFGAGNSRDRGGCLHSVASHLLLGRIYNDKDVQERIVRRSKLDWVIVRPVILTNGPTTNAYRALVRSTRLDMQVHLARRRGGFSRQADQQQCLSASDAGAHELR